MLIFQEDMPFLPLLLIIKCSISAEFNVNIDLFVVEMHIFFLSTKKDNPNIMVYCSVRH